MKFTKEHFINFITEKYRKLTLRNVEQHFYGPNKLNPLRRWTGPLRLLPNFIIIGAQRSGTATLFQTLNRHPNFFRPIGRESNYFLLFYIYGRNKAWYKVFFPSVFYKYFIKYIRKRDFITGESTPYYLFHPLAPERIYKMLPNCKMIALLRNPVDRAYSQYIMNKRKGREKLSFEEVIETEKIRLEGVVDKILSDENYYSRKHQHYSYLLRGIYIDQIKNWHKYYPKEQLLIIKSEDLYNSPAVVLKRVLEFLNQPTKPINKIINKDNKKKIHLHKEVYPKMKPETRKRLTEYFRPYNEALYKYLTVNFNWEDNSK
ncbi:MAG: sulfotransferase [Promethearchaeota archaeon]